jgi:hypothetical protein
MTIELLSPLSDANRDADARAFAALMRHIKAVDGQQHTVITIQVENEVGMQGDTRDRSPLANQAYAGPVPKELMDYLQKHKDTLIPELRRVWEAAGLKTSGTWEEVFGQGRPTDEFFMAWNFARYINRVVEAGKAEYPIPMITNYPEMESRKETAPLFGGGQSGGPGADDMDVWRAGAPLIDIFGADIYVPDFVGFCAKYTQSGNPLFINETGGGRLTAARALYAFGRHDAIAFSPFAIETHLGLGNLPGLADTYDLLSLLAPLILEHQGKGMMSAVLLGPNDPPQKVKVGNYTLEAAFLGPRFLFGLEPEKDPPPSVAIFIATGPDEYYVAGNGVRVTFSPNTPGPPLAGLATVEQGTFVNGRWVPGMQLAGDETRQGMYLEVRNIIGIQRVTLYRYR